MRPFPIRIHTVMASDKIKTKTGQFVGKKKRTSRKREVVSNFF